MSGAALSISMTVRDEAVRRAFADLQRKMANTRPVMAAIGEGLVASTQQRFVSQTSPGGDAWQSLNTEYAKGKRNKRILTESGRLRNSINAQAGNDEVRIGTNVIYAAVHQFGATITPKNASHLFFRINGRTARADSVTLPARPFLGISSADETMIADVVFDFLDHASSAL